MKYIDIGRKEDIFGIRLQNYDHGAVEYFKFSSIKIDMNGVTISIQDEEVTPDEFVTIEEHHYNWDSIKKVEFIHKGE